MGDKHRIYLQANQWSAFQKFFYYAKISNLHRRPLGTSLYNQTDCPPLVGSAMECADSAIIKTTCGFPMYTTDRLAQAAS